MAFKKQTQKILTGGINLLAPGDLLDETCGEAAKNWRVDTYGNLRSRDGMTSVMSFDDGYVHSLCLVERSDGLQRYAGAGFRLWRSTSGAASAARDANTGAEVAFSGNQLGMVSYDNWCWVMDQTTQGRDDGASTGTGSFYKWLPDAPTAAPGVSVTSGALGGAVKYYVTYSTANDYESNPSPVSAEVSNPGSAFGVTVTVPVSGDVQVTKRHIYREGGMLPSPYRVYTIEDNTTASWIDDGTISDSMAVEDGYLLEEDHDPPPEAQILAGPYNNRLIAGCSLTHPNRVYWTPATLPYYFPGSTSDAEGNWVDVGSMYEQVVAISCKTRMVIIYKEHSIWRIIGDLDDGVLEQTNSDTGLIGRKAWCSEGGYDYFQGREGIYRFDGDHAVKISERVDPIFKGWQSGSTDINPVRPIDPDLRKYAAMAIKHGRLYFSYPEQGA